MDSQSWFVVLFAVVFGLGSMAWFLYMQEREFQRQDDEDAARAAWRRAQRDSAVCRVINTNRQVAPEGHRVNGRDQRTAR